LGGPFWNKVNNKNDNCSHSGRSTIDWNLCNLLEGKNLFYDGNKWNPVGGRSSEELNEICLIQIKKDNCGKHLKN